MKTLAELRRDARSGNMSMEMLEWYGKTGEDIKANLRGIRKVEGANSVALLLRNNEGNISELRVRYATLVEYDGVNLTVYEAGHRDLTEDEKKILSEWERIEKEYLEKNPFAETFWKRRDYFSKCSCPWLYGTDTVKGKRLEYVDHEPKIRDREIRGVAVLKYKVYFTKGGICSA